MQAELKEERLKRIEREAVDESFAMHSKLQRYDHTYDVNRDRSIQVGKPAHKERRLIKNSIQESDDDEMIPYKNYNVIMQPKQNKSKSRSKSKSRNSKSRERLISKQVKHIESNLKSRKQVVSLKSVGTSSRNRLPKDGKTRNQLKSRDSMMSKLSLNKSAMSNQAISSRTKKPTNKQQNKKPKIKKSSSRSQIQNALNELGIDPSKSGQSDMLEQLASMVANIIISNKPAEQSIGRKMSVASSIKSQTPFKQS